MSVNSVLAVILFLGLEHTGIIDVAAQERVCEDGWHKMNSTSYPDGTICIQVNTDPKSWPEAKAHCSGSISNLISLDEREIYSFEIEIPYDETTTRVGDIMVNIYNLNEFWSGMFLSKEGRLMWDDYGPKYVDKFHYTVYNKLNWDHDQPDPTQGDCGRTVLGTQQIVDSIDFEFNGAINVSLADCSRRLPFICKKKSVEVVVQPAHFCEENWYGNQYVPVCYQIFKEPLPFLDARASCESHNGRLALAFLDFEREMISAVSTYYQWNGECM
ncbi:uncharacterized protein LOC128241696 [Mya arenaria]|uniref:uncharacterized protein LOC128241696 n=1 Tax=Mya arenaria TaxID=6604 RepID=UPI0022DF9D6F|nr:uncharacterized protein LOC128241696 [Mya arenaria]